MFMTPAKRYGTLFLNTSLTKKMRTEKNKSVDRHGCGMIEKKKTPMEKQDATAIVTPHLSAAYFPILDCRIFYASANIGTRTEGTRTFIPSCQPKMENTLRLTA